jgi:hypothetical protein
MKVPPYLDLYTVAKKVRRSSRKMQNRSKYHRAEWERSWEEKHSGDELELDFDLVEADKDARGTFVTEEGQGGEKPAGIYLIFNMLYFILEKKETTPAAPKEEKK